MAELIDISITELENHIATLQMLHDDWLSSEQMRRSCKPPVRGSGQVNAALDVVMTELEHVNDAILVLVENSIHFFTNVKTSVVGADENAAGAIRE